MLVSLLTLLAISSTRVHATRTKKGTVKSEDVNVIKDQTEGQDESVVSVTIEEEKSEEDTAVNLQIEVNVQEEQEETENVLKNTTAEISGGEMQQPTSSQSGTKQDNKKKGKEKKKKDKEKKKRTGKNRKENEAKEEVEAVGTREHRSWQHQRGSKFVNWRGYQSYGRTTRPRRPWQKFAQARFSPGDYVCNGCGMVNFRRNLYCVDCNSPNPTRLCKKDSTTQTSSTSSSGSSSNSSSSNSSYMECNP